MQTKFKAQLEKDISAVFLNLKEFAEQIDLDGQELTAILEDLELAADNNRDNAAYESVPAYEGVTIYAKANCLHYTYSPHKSCMLNGEQWFVLKSSVEQGLAIIQLYREKA